MLFIVAVTCPGEYGLVLSRKGLTKKRSAISHIDYDRLGLKIFILDLKQR